MRIIAIAIVASSMAACSMPRELEQRCASYTQELGWHEVDCSTLPAREEAARALRSAQIQAEYEWLHENIK